MSNIPLNKEGIVYLLCDAETNLYKIGVTRGSLEKRIKKLQTGNGSELHCVYSFVVPFPFRLEKLLHIHFANKKVLNEWFALEDEDIFNFKDTVDEKMELIKTMLDNPFFVKNIS